MLIHEIMEKKQMSKYRLSKESGMPYTTICDICSGKAKLQNCSGETIYKICRTLHIPMEELLAPYLEPRISFDLFKSNTCHRLKELGDTGFIIETLESDEIRRYARMHWYSESLYLLAMVDYISRVNQIPLCTEYSDLRKCKLPEPLYPSSILALSAVSKDQADTIKEKAKQEAIPEFMRFNIIESEVRNVI